MVHEPLNAAWMSSSCTWCLILLLVLYSKLKKKSKLWASKKPLLPTCMVYNCSVIPFSLAASSRCRYCASFPIAASLKFVSQQIASSKRCICCWFQTILIMSGPRLVSMYWGIQYSLSPRSAVTVRRMRRCANVEIRWIGPYHALRCSIPV